MCVRELPYGPSTTSRQKASVSGTRMPQLHVSEKEKRLSSSRGEPFNVNSRSHVLQICPLGHTREGERGESEGCLLPTWRTRCQRDQRHLASLRDVASAVIRDMRSLSLTLSCRPAQGMMVAARGDRSRPERVWKFPSHLPPSHALRLSALTYGRSFLSRIRVWPPYLVINFQKTQKEEVGFPSIA